MSILCFNLAITLILFVLASDNLIGTFVLYCKIQECRFDSKNNQMATSFHNSSLPEMQVKQN
jgi:hypothetical protein